MSKRQYKYKYIILKADTSAGDPGMEEIEAALEEGYTPMRETPMPSSCGGPVIIGPRVLCILKKTLLTNSEEDTQRYGV